MSRQHKRTLAWLLVGTLTFGVFYLWSARPADPLAIPFDVHETYMNDRSSWSKLRSRQSYDWKQAPFVKKIEKYIEVPLGPLAALPEVQAKFPPETSPQRRSREERRTAVRDEFQRTWESYRRHAWAKDELKPTAGEGLDTFGGWGATLVDSLDTLWIMGFKDYFYEAVEAVAEIDFGKSESKSISVFETTIRYLGGLLSAYDLSAEPVLLEKAIQLGEMLYRAFDTTNNTPQSSLYIEDTKVTGRSEFPAEFNLCFACIGSLTMEFTRLAQITSQAKYYDIVAKLTIMMDRTSNSTAIPGLWPTSINAANEQFNSSRYFSIGAMADSTYEYFPKMYALLGRDIEPLYKKLYQDSAAMIDKHMLFRPMVPDEKAGKDLLFCGDIYVADDNEKFLHSDLQHLTCFIGGMFGLAGRLFSNEHDVTLGTQLTQGCIYSYAWMPTGIMPEKFSVLPCESRTTCPWNETAWKEEASKFCRQHWDEEKNEQATDCDDMPPKGITNLEDPRYLLRPEAIESVFIMYRITADRQYLDAAWNMFRSVVTASRTTYANGQVRDVTFVPQTREYKGRKIPMVQRVPGVRGGMVNREDNVEDKMESFWTAETLKYFYLIFSREDMISLDEWVFNTEAHPFRRARVRDSG